MSNCQGKEKNFISAVIYLHNDGRAALDFFTALNAELDAHFEKYELIAIDDACSDNTIELIKGFAATLDKPLTILHMSLYQKRENSMNAGLDAAIGDYVLEFDSTDMPYDASLIYDAYKTALEGNDIVLVCPNRAKKSSRLFYRLFNDSSRSSYKLRTDVFRLVSRRAINRVHASSSYLPYRKAAYVASGLKIEYIYFAGAVKLSKSDGMALAVDSLALYTVAGYRASIGITLLMMLAALIEALYALVIYLIGKPIEGWTTLMLVVTFGFAGLFFILSILVKYATLILNMGFKKQKYLIESIEKIQK